MEHNVSGNHHAKDELPIFPKPRRLVHAIPEFLYPVNCKHSHSGHQEGSEILDMISRKSDQRRESTVIYECSPSCYCGSPPTRSSNPMVHDSQFISRMELYSPFTGANLVDKLDFGPPSPLSKLIEQGF